MTLVLRLLALLGSVAHGVDRSVDRLLAFLPIRVPGTLVVVALLAGATWNAVAETNRAIAARPAPIHTTIDDLVDEPSTAWVSVSGLLSGPHLDNSIYATDRRPYFLRISDDPHDHVIEGPGEPLLTEPGRRQTIFPLTIGDGVTRWFYVLRDAEGGDRALVVRSSRGGDEIRVRSVMALASGSIDGLPHLVEVADAGAEEATGSVSRVRDGERAIFRATFHADAVPVACGGGDACRGGRTWRYHVTDVAQPDASAWLDSAHPPDALPVTLNGVVATDAGRMRVVLGTDEMAAALDGLAHPDDVVLADNSGPRIPEATYLWAVILGSIAAVLLLSATIRYPVFHRRARQMASGLPRPVVDELISVEVSGELPGSLGLERPSRAPAQVGWLPARELVRRAWHLHRNVIASEGDAPRLALVALEGGFVLPLEPIRTRLRVDVGLVATSSNVRPAMRLIGPDVRLMLAFGSEADRDRVRHELHPEAHAPTVGPIPVPAGRRLPARRPWARPVTASALAATAVLMAGNATQDLLVSAATPIAAGLAMLAAVGIGLLAIGVVRGHSLAVDLLPSVAVLGIVAAGVATVALPGCGTWLTPNLVACPGVDLVALATSVTGIAAFGLSLWAVPHLSATRART